MHTECEATSIPEQPLKHFFAFTAQNYAKNAEKEIEFGRLVTVSKKRARVNVKILDRTLTNLRQREVNTENEKIKIFETNLATLNCDNVTTIKKITTFQSKYDEAKVQNEQLATDFKEYKTSAGVLTENQNTRIFLLSSKTLVLEKKIEHYSLTLKN
uniref:Protein phosphatase 1 regulatory subunit 21 n=1 Tax=Strongyloides venezuelensis TaxID=75913 RepID=A0A0K0FPS6_STRVS